jgi:hypothetical protein
MGVSNEAKNVIPLKFLRKIKNKNVFPLLNSIRGHKVYCPNVNKINCLLTFVSPKPRLTVIVSVNKQECQHAYTVNFLSMNHRKLHGVIVFIVLPL